MPNFNLTLTALQSAGITKAREGYNLANPDVFDGDTLVEQNTFATDLAYLQFVVDSATTGWAEQHKVGTIPSSDFLLRIPGVKFAAMLEAQGSDTNLAKLIARVKSLSEIRLSAAETVGGAGYLVAAGYLTQQEADALLAY